jgi:hypothetical protein
MNEFKHHNNTQSSTFDHLHLSDGEELMHYKSRRHLSINDSETGSLK